MTPHPLRHGLLAAVCLLPFVSAQAPRFVDGDVGKLRASVRKLLPMSNNAKRSPGTLVVVEVRNGTTHCAEPNRFLLEIERDANGKKVAPVDATRFARGTWGRGGRAVPPGGQLRYTLQLPIRLGPRPKVRVRVTEASFFAGQPSVRPKVRPTGLKVEGYMYGNVNPIRTYRTRLNLRNPLDQTLDVAFLARSTRPFEGKILIRTRLAPHQDLAWSLDEIVFDSGQPQVGIGIRSLELIDWSVVWDEGQERAETLLRTTWKRWYRWPEQNPPVGADFALTVRIEPHADALRPEPVQRRSFQGSFRLVDGKLVVDGSRLTPDDRQHATRILADALADLRRPPVEETLAKTRLRLALGGKRPRLAFHGKGWDWRSGNGGPDWIPTLTLADGAIVASGIQDRPYPDARWHTRALGDGFVVTRRVDPLLDVRIEFGEALGLVVPFGCTTAQTLTNVRVTTRRLRLFNWRRLAAGEARPPAPTGTGAKALRALWDAGYRYPKKGVKLRGTVRVAVRPDTEGLWEGQRKLAGTFVVRGYRGQRYEEAEVELRGKLGRAQRQRLADVVVDRFRIWYGRDFNARRPFDTVFAGARVQTLTGRPGVFRVTGGPYREVRTRDGLITAVVYPSGQTREFTYQKVGPHQLVTRVTMGRSDVQARYRLIRGVPVPIEMRFRRVFGNDWGPEELKFAGVRVGE